MLLSGIHKALILQELDSRLNTSGMTFGLLQEALMTMRKLKSDIKKLLKERNAILLAHNYQRDEIQEVADLTGDSLGLSIEASKTEAKVIVFCGVQLMAESASILSPNKTVIFPRMD